jgi:hypothetical protein
MTTSVTVSANGRIDAVTDLKSCQTHGFTGGVWISLLDKNKNVLHITKVRSYGVDGKGPLGLFTGGRCGTRKASWGERISQTLANQVDSLIIEQGHTPKPRISKEDVCEAIERGSKLFK